ncbi:hypothetical protein XaraCFBP7407_20445 [Xanthomonas arboricola pv. arracaciae]|nr:hypothetical protein XaraCFBP7407_20445 [Xanthomonas arboricola pv. arracaciae]
MHAAKGPAIGEGTAPNSWSVATWKAACRSPCIGHRACASASNNAHQTLSLDVHTNHPDWSLPAYRRGTLRGMDAA